MKIILIEDVNNLGKKGDIKEVANGYAQNFLLPQKKGILATENAIRNVQIEKEKETKEEKAKTEELKKIAEELKSKKIILTAKEKGGKLFGSITTKDIAEELKKQDLDIAENAIEIKNAIKKVGQHKIKIKLSKDINIELNLEIKGD